MKGLRCFQLRKIALQKVSHPCSLSKLFKIFLVDLIILSRTPPKWEAVEKAEMSFYAVIALSIVNIKLLLLHRLVLSHGRPQLLGRFLETLPCTIEIFELQFLLIFTAFFHPILAVSTVKFTSKVKRSRVLLWKVRLISINSWFSYLFHVPFNWYICHRQFKSFSH